jgi:hypothetical protein
VEDDVTTKHVQVTGITIAVSSGTSDSGNASGSETTFHSNKMSMGAESDNGAAGWFRPLDRPVELPGGMTLITLAEAGAYILDLPEKVKRRESWQRATDLLLKAASGEERVEVATAQIEHALLMELTLLLSGQDIPSENDGPDQSASFPDHSPKYWK